MAEGRKQFTFYRSYYEALQELPKREQTSVLMAIIGYALDGAEPNLTGTSRAVFLLIKPTLDAGRKKAENGKSGGKPKQTESKPQANGKQTASKSEANDKQSGSEKEREKEREIEKENEDECLIHGDADVSAVVSAWMNKINPSEPQMNLQELIGYVRSMGKDVCLRAIDITLSNLKGNACWAYTRSILQRWTGQGVKCLADVERVESKREKAKKAGGKGGIPDYRYEGDDTL